MSKNPYDENIFGVLTKFDSYTDQHLELRSDYDGSAYSYLLWRVCQQSHAGGISSDSFIRRLYGVQYDVFFDLADMIVSTVSFTESDDEPPRT